MRPPFSYLLIAALASSLSCSNPTEVESTDVTFAVNISWPAGAQPLTAARLSATTAFIEVRRGGAEVVVSETGAIDPSLATVPLSVEVPVRGSSESLTVLVRLRAGATALFEASAPVTLAGAGNVPLALTVAWVGAGADAATITLTPLTDTVPSSGTVSFDATLRNAADAVVAPPIHWTVSDPLKGSITQAGEFTGAGIVGSVTITALAATGQSAGATIVLRGTADELVVVSGDEQTSPPAATFAPVAVQVLDGGAPVDGAEVTWAVVQGDASVSVAEPTGLDGISTVTVEAGADAGPVRIEANVDGVVAVFDLEVVPGPPTSATEVGSPTTIYHVSRPTSQAPQVLIQDDHGNAVQGVPVQFAIASGGGSIEGTNPVVTAPSGLAQPSWRLGPQYGEQSYTATTPCTPEGGCLALTVTRFAHLRLDATTTREIISGEGQVGATGIAFPSPVVFRIRDFGQGIAGVPVRVWALGGAADFSVTETTTDAQGEIVVSVTPFTPGSLRIAFQVDEPRAAFIVTGTLTATPTGFSHAWLGATADWDSPANWSAGTVPTAADSVHIPEGTPFAPVLGSARAVGSLLHDDPRPLQLAGHILTVHGSLRTASSVAGPGLVEMTGTQRFVGGDISALRLHGITTLTEESAFGRLELETGSELRLGTSGSLTVSDSAIFRGGFPRMSSSLNHVTIHHAVFESGTMPDDMMTAGTLAITGDLLVPGSLRTFGEHELVFQHRLPLVARRLAIADAGPSATRIQRLSIDSQGSMPVVVDGGLHVVGPMDVAGVLEVAEGVNAEIGGVLTVGVGSIVRVFGTMTVGSCNLPNGPVLLIGFSCPAP